MSGVTQEVYDRFHTAAEAWFSALQAVGLGGPLKPLQEAEAVLLEARADYVRTMTENGLAEAVDIEFEAARMEAGFQEHEESVRATLAKAFGVRAAARIMRRHRRDLIRQHADDVAAIRVWAIEARIKAKINQPWTFDLERFATDRDYAAFFAEIITRKCIEELS